MKTPLMTEMEATHGDLFNVFDAFIKEHGQTFVPGRTVLQVNERTMQWFKDIIDQIAPTTPKSERYSHYAGFEASYKEWPMEATSHCRDGQVLCRVLPEPEGPSSEAMEKGKRAKEFEAAVLDDMQLHPFQLTYESRRLLRSISRVLAFRGMP